jgi:hypothetical protein
MATPQVVYESLSRVTFTGAGPYVRVAAPVSLDRGGGVRQRLNQDAPPGTTTFHASSPILGFLGDTLKVYDADFVEAPLVTTTVQSCAHQIARPVRTAVTNVIEVAARVSPGDTLTLTFSEDVTINEPEGAPDFTYTSGPPETTSQITYTGTGIGLLHLVFEGTTNDGLLVGAEINSVSVLGEPLRPFAVQAGAVGHYFGTTGGLYSFTNVPPSTTISFNGVADNLQNNAFANLPSFSYSGAVLSTPTPELRRLVGYNPPLLWRTSVPAASGGNVVATRLGSYTGSMVLEYEFTDGSTARVSTDKYIAPAGAFVDVGGTRVGITIMDLPGLAAATPLDVDVVRRLSHRLIEPTILVRAAWTADLTSAVDVTPAFSASGLASVIAVDLARETLIDDAYGFSDLFASTDGSDVFFRNVGDGVITVVVNATATVDGNTVAPNTPIELSPMQSLAQFPDSAVATASITRNGTALAFPSITPLFSGNIEVAVVSDTLLTDVVVVSSTGPFEQRFPTYAQFIAIYPSPDFTVFFSGRQPAVFGSSANGAALYVPDEGVLAWSSEPTPSVQLLDAASPFAFIPGAGSDGVMFGLMQESTTVAPYSASYTPIVERASNDVVVGSLVVSSTAAGPVLVGISDPAVSGVALEEGTATLSASVRQAYFGVSTVTAVVPVSPGGSAPLVLGGSTPTREPVQADLQVLQQPFVLSFANAQSSGGLRVRYFAASFAPDVAAVAPALTHSLATDGLYSLLRGLQASPSLDEAILFGESAQPSVLQTDGAVTGVLVNGAVTRTDLLLVDSARAANTLGNVWTYIAEFGEVSTVYTLAGAAGTVVAEYPSAATGQLRLQGAAYLWISPGPAALAAASPLPDFAGTAADGRTVLAARGRVDLAAYSPTAPASPVSPDTTVFPLSLTGPFTSFATAPAAPVGNAVYPYSGIGAIVAAAGEEVTLPPDVLPDSGGTVVDNSLGGSPLMEVVYRTPSALPRTVSASLVAFDDGTNTRWVAWNYVPAVTPGVVEEVRGGVLDAIGDAVLQGAAQKGIYFAAPNLAVNGPHATQAGTVVVIAADSTVQIVVDAVPLLPAQALHPMGRAVLNTGVTNPAALADFTFLPCTGAPARTRGGFASTFTVRATASNPAAPWFGDAALPAALGPALFLSPAVAPALAAVTYARTFTNFAVDPAAAHAPSALLTATAPLTAPAQEHTDAAQIGGTLAWIVALAGDGSWAAMPLSAAVAVVSSRVQQCELFATVASVRSSTARAPLPAEVDYTTILATLFRASDALAFRMEDGAVVFTGGLAGDIPAGLTLYAQLRGAGAIPAQFTLREDVFGAGSDVYAFTHPLPENLQLGQGSAPAVVSAVGQHLYWAAARRLYPWSTPGGDTPFPTPLPGSFFVLGGVTVRFDATFVNGVGRNQSLRAEGFAALQTMVLYPNSITRSDVAYARANLVNDQLIARAVALSGTGTRAALLGAGLPTVSNAALWQTL